MQVVKEAARQPRVERNWSHLYSSMPITSPTMLTLALTGLLLAMTPSHVQGHGYMLIPPGRSTAWRHNATEYFYTNYDDNANYCGGFGVQFNENGGKCGVCGDNYAQDVPRDNERGGYYASTGNIVAQYASGDIIDVAIVLTANHFGTFFFDICPSNDPKEPETEDCFQPLLIKNGKDKWELPNWKKDTFLVQLQIPKWMTCYNCVLRWKYVTGNSWGCEYDMYGKERCCTGCGSIQEHFFSCSDVMITRSGRERIPPWKKVDKSSATTTKRTTTTTTTTRRPRVTTTRRPRVTTTRRPRKTTTRRPRKTTTTVATTTTTENRFCSEICDHLCKPGLQKFCFVPLCDQCDSHRVLQRIYNKG